jgi:hypothetical protein
VIDVLAIRERWVQKDAIKPLVEVCGIEIQEVPPNETYSVRLPKLRA